MPHQKSETPLGINDTPVSTRWKILPGSPVTGVAVLRRAPVDRDIEVLSRLRVGVAHLARDVFMSSIQREGRVLVVVEARRSPVETRVADGTFVFAVSLVELSGVNVFVALGAL